MKYTFNNKINQVYDRHYQLKYLSNMNIKAYGVEGGKMTAVSNFLECKNGCGDDADFEQIC